jgi:hypothetical protein
MAVKETTLGRFYEDFEVGDVYRHPLGRTITDTDNVWFTLLTMNTNPNHFDYAYAEKSEFGKPLVNSGLTVAIVLGQSVIDTSQQAFANLGWDKIRLPNRSSLATRSMPRALSSKSANRTRGPMPGSSRSRPVASTSMGMTS